MGSLSFKLLAVVGVLALTTGCMGRVNEIDICEAALEGVNDSEYTAHIKCREDVARSAFTSAHLAAQKYRDMPR